MATITKEEIILLATLSRLALHEDELPALQQHVEDVLAYAKRVTEVARDVDAMEISLSNRLRDDIPVSSNVEDIMSQAPAREGNYFVVPRILEHT